MRSFVVASFVLSLIGIGTAAAAECPPGALGTSRTIVVDPTEHTKLGGFQYRESLPLKDKEVVLTFDDGPLPPYTTRVLDTLASECIKATFFMVGRMVRAYPQLVHRIYNEGHTVANHSQNHPFTFHKMTVEHASQEIEDGFMSLRSVLGDPKAVAPFFRIPGLLRQDSVEHYLASRGYMTWSVDFSADDWTRIKADEIARRAIERMEAKGRGILLLHDIQPATALALPTILQELKARGFKIVHVQAATPDRPKTVTEPEQWALRSGVPQQQFWPRVVPTANLDNAPTLAAPNPANFGVTAAPGGSVKLALAPALDRGATHDGDARPTPVPLWPRQASYAIPPETDLLPVPGVQNFRYVRAFRLPNMNRTKVATKKPAPPPAAAPRDQHTVGAASGSPTHSTRPPRPVGHQISVVRTPFSIIPFGLR